MSTGSEHKGWWTTLPGMLTAIAGLLTAVTGLLVALNQIGVLGGSEPSEPDLVDETTVGVPGDRPPAAAVEDTSQTADGWTDSSPGEVVLRYYEALRAGDWAGVQATLAPNAEIDVAALRMVRSQAGALDQISDQLTALFEVPEATKGGAPAPAAGEVRIESTRRTGGTARVVVVPADGVSPARHSMELVRTGGTWRILRQGAAP